MYTGSHDFEIQGKSIWCYVSHLNSNVFYVEMLLIDLSFQGDKIHYHNKNL